jgi:predicted Zn-dependent protease
MNHNRAIDSTKRIELNHIRTDKNETVTGLYFKLLISLILLTDLAFLSFPSDVLSRPVTSEQVDEITVKIEKDPNNAELYLRRGELLVGLKKWDAALVDFERARSLDNELEVVDMVKGRLFLDAGWSRAAEFYLSRYLSFRPDHPDALLLLARCLAKQGRGNDAGKIYDRFLVITKNPKPDYYLERADALVSAGMKPEALKGLDEGLVRFGPVTSLQKMAIDIELVDNNYTSALSRIQSLIGSSPQKERWLLLRGETLEKVGRTKDAKESYDEGLKNLESRPLNKRRTTYFVNLEKEIREAIRRLEDKT